MDKHFKVRFSSPDSNIIFDSVYLLSLCSIEGELVILPDHSPFIIYLLPGPVALKTLKEKEKEKKVIVDNAVLKVANNYCIIMTNRLQKDDIDWQGKNASAKNASVQHYLDYVTTAKESKEN